MRAFILYESTSCVPVPPCQVVVVPKRHPRDLPPELQQVDAEVLEPQPTEQPESTSIAGGGQCYTGDPLHRDAARNALPYTVCNVRCAAPTCANLVSTHTTSCIGPAIVPAPSEDDALLHFLIFMMGTFIQQQQEAHASAPGTPAAVEAGPTGRSLGPTGERAVAIITSTTASGALAAEAASAYGAQLEEQEKALRAARFKNTKLAWELGETRRKYEAR